MKNLFLNSGLQVFRITERTQIEALISSDFNKAYILQIRKEDFYFRWVV